LISCRHCQQISGDTHAALGEESDEWVCRGSVTVKGKGSMNTFLMMPNSVEDLQTLVASGFLVMCC
jgi:hypothetical protein